MASALSACEPLSAGCPFLVQSFRHQSRPSPSDTCSLAQAGLNWDASVSNVGFCGSSLEHLWLTSNTEGLCLWEWQAACDEEGAGQSPYIPPPPPSLQTCTRLHSLLMDMPLVDVLRCSACQIPAHLMPAGPIVCLLGSTIVASAMPVGHRGIARVKLARSASGQG